MKNIYLKIPFIKVNPKKNAIDLQILELELSGNYKQYFMRYSDVSGSGISIQKMNKENNFSVSVSSLKRRGNPLLPHNPVHAKRFPSPSRSIHLRDVSEAVRKAIFSPQV